MNVEVLTNPDAVSLLPAGVVFKQTLVRPPLSNHSKLIIPNLALSISTTKFYYLLHYQFLHVAGLGLWSIGLLSPGNLGSQLIVLVQNALLASIVELSVDSLGSAGI